jgi:hypothetical protein
MKWFYIRFDYDHYCQGWEDESETLMIQAIDFYNACRLIKNKYENARNFKDLTLRETANF